MTTPALAFHSKATPSWGTPYAIVKMAREVMGDIDCDPCSSEYWNEYVVQAWESWDERGGALDYLEPGGLVRDGLPLWNRFFINPPGGLVKEFWRFATARWQEGSVVFWVGFNFNQFTYLAREGLFYPGFVRACPFSRLRYLRAVGGGPPVPGDAPPHGSYLALLPSSDEQVARFRELARAFGEVF